MKNHWINRRQRKTFQMDCSPLLEALEQVQEILTASFALIQQAEDIIQKIELPVMINESVIGFIKPFDHLSFREFMETDSEDLDSLCKAENIADFHAPKQAEKG